MSREKWKDIVGTASMRFEGGYPMVDINPGAEEYDAILWASRRIEKLEAAVEWALDDRKDWEIFCEELRRRAKEGG